MRRWFLCVFSITVLSFSGLAQQWQQEVNYEIKVVLNDSLHALDGYTIMQYHNNSPDTLRHIYMHLWPNAYSTLTTAFAGQQLENGNTEFYFSKKNERGYIAKLNFTVNGKTAEFIVDTPDVDIGKLVLPQPLYPGKSISIATPFYVKLPNSFSRLGHVGQSYQITQWYPKPAVYNKNGWHPIPYLDQGEFYSEFGRFEVEITLPENYVVGATGNLQNREELKWLDALASRTAEIEEFDDDMTFPPSSDTMKTLRYVQDNVHDFAWFADKRYHVLKGRVALPGSGDTVTTWAMFTNKQAEHWKKSLTYIDSSVYYCSLWVGDYPYEQATAVEGALSAGGGMEYPTITIIGSVGSDRSLDNVIAHEVGHNWFYGILGSNERLHPWMDEGINTYYENRYMKARYGDLPLIPELPGVLMNFLDIEHYNREDAMPVFYQALARRKLDQPIEQPSEPFTNINYGVIVYGKTGAVFKHLEAYLGEEQFDQVMQAYYRQFKFRHPGPEDLRRLFEEHVRADLGWFFDDLMGTTKKLDYGIKNVDVTDDMIWVRVHNSGDINAPFPISAVKDDSVITTVWYKGAAGDTIVSFPYGDYDYLRIDANHVTTEIDRSDNTYQFKGLFPRLEPFRLQFFATLENPYKTQLFLAPVLSWNNYDKANVGLVFFNSLIPRKRFEYFISPMYGTGSNELTGILNVGYNWYPEQLFSHINLNVTGERFSYFTVWKNDPEILQYQKITPELKLELPPSHARSRTYRFLQLESHLIEQEIPVRNEGEFDIDANSYAIYRANYVLENKRVINPLNFSVAIEGGMNDDDTYLKTYASGEFKVTYNKPNKGLQLRLFAGTFFHNNLSSNRPPDSEFKLNHSTGFRIFQKDYTFEESYLGRSETTGFLSQQIAERDGGFRSLTSIGQNDEWLASININSTLPLPDLLPIRLFTSGGLYPKNSFNPDGPGETEVKFAYELGASIVLLEDVIEINFPFLVSDDIKDSQEFSREKYGEKISFMLNMDMLKMIYRLRDLQIR